MQSQKAKERVLMVRAVSSVKYSVEVQIRDQEREGITCRLQDETSMSCVYRKKEGRDGLKVGSIRKGRNNIHTEFLKG